MSEIKMLEVRNPMRKMTEGIQIDSVINPNIFKIMW